MDGDCGSVVVNAATGHIYGHVVAGDPMSNLAYIIPTYKIFDAIENMFRVRPSLPLPIEAPRAARAALKVDKKYTCPYCSTEFRRYHRLTSHILTHSHEKHYYETSDMRSRLLHDLKRHANLHTSESLHTCAKCDRSFTRLYAFATHATRPEGCAGRKLDTGNIGDENGASEKKGI